MGDTPDTSGAGPMPLRLREWFPPVTTAEWEAVARQDLKGQDYEQRLVWRAENGLTIKPFYRAEDIESLPECRAAVPGAPPYLRGGGPGWHASESADWPAAAVRADLLHEAGATAVEELGWALAEGVERIAVASETGASLDEAASATSFVFAVGSTYFVEIAKLRAARLLWWRVLQAFAPDDPDRAAASGPMRLHARTSRANKSVYDPYTNLLRATTEAMAGVIGGADSLLVEPHGFDAHLAINVQRILAEEAHLDAVADPAGGSYFIEALTDALAREAWALLQRIEAAGGHAAAVRGGLLEQQLHASRTAREQAVSSRRRTLVGVNNYPDLTEHGPAAGPFPQPDDEGPLTPVRLAAPFEALRARTARHAAAAGRTPVVHLLTGGDARMRMARANFCRNFFGCAGLAITQGDTLPADADLIVLCAADDDYPALAVGVVPLATVPVIVAGNPNAHIESLTAAGVQGFVHVHSDAVYTLTLWQDRLGMAP
jgi:methylmalonyl-CoA mutase